MLSQYLIITISLSERVPIYPSHQPIILHFKLRICYSKRCSWHISNARNPLFFGILFVQLFQCWKLPCSHFTLFFVVLLRTRSLIYQGFCGWDSINKSQNVYMSWRTIWRWLAYGVLYCPDVVTKLNLSHFLLLQILGSFSIYFHCSLNVFMTKNIL